MLSVGLWHLLELRKQVGPIRTISCVRRRNWSAWLCGSNWPSVSSCLDTASAAAAQWPELVTLERSARALPAMRIDSSFTPQRQPCSFQSHYIAITTTQLLSLPPFRFRHHARVTEVTAALTCTVYSNTVTDLSHDSSWPQFRIQWTVPNTKLESAMSERIPCAVIPVTRTAPKIEKVLFWEKRPLKGKNQNLATKRYIRIGL